MDLTITGYSSKDRDAVQLVLAQLGWTANQMDGQMASIERFSSAPRDRVYVAWANNRLAGYISVELHLWNNLAQIQGLAVDPSLRRRKIGAKLVGTVEEYVRENRVRGLYVDTPVNNVGGREFYERLGYQQDYVMTEYYDVGLDGVTYLKLFK
jgi:ribosomal protein S18 acetylase RimI-like enzyme